MKIIYELTEKELECLKKIVKFKNYYSYSSEFDEFREEFEEELNSFFEEGFTESDEDSYYITYYLTNKAKNFIKNIKLQKMRIK